MACKENLKNIEGTVANVLNRHLKEIEPYMSSPSKILELREKVNEILHSPEITTEPGRQKAIKTLYNAKTYNHYLSILGTWLSGITC